MRRVLVCTLWEAASKCKAGDCTACWSGGHAAEQERAKEALARLAAAALTPDFASSRWLVIQTGQPCGTRSPHSATMPSPSPPVLPSGTPHSVGSKTVAAIKTGYVQQYAVRYAARLASALHTCSNSAALCASMVPSMSPRHLTCAPLPRRRRRRRRRPMATATARPIAALPRSGSGPSGVAPLPIACAHPMNAPLQHAPGAGPPQAQYPNHVNAQSLAADIMARMAAANAARTDV